MRLVLVDGQRISQMARRATDHQTVVGSVQLFLGVATQTHLDHAGSGDCQLIGTLGCLFTKNKETDQQEAYRDKDEDWNEVAGRSNHVAC